MKHDSFQHQNTHSDSENTPIRKRTFLRQDDQGLYLLDTEEGMEGSAPMKLSQSVIHFFFCIDGKATFSFGPQYSREILGGNSYFFYNPEKELSFQLSLEKGTKLVAMCMTLDGIHKLFVRDSQELPFLSSENANRKFYDEREISPALRVVLNQLVSVQLSDNALQVFYQGKIYEILGLYFSNRQPDKANCPFLNDEETVRKLKNAKELLLKNLENAPTLKELARATGLNDYQLKVGFKEIYGNTVYGYLLDHKMDHSRVLLDTGKYKVNEVASMVGYTNTSHYIAAFRKKFGVTPKKYLMSRARG
ncbi:MAG: AraC family transcriptional regulator [Cyclobacteriaceae bacterium]|nr:AraC family transcriptional regulator [Cyclobacteriaceae bacterium]